MITDKWHNGSAVINGQELSVYEKGRLPNRWSAQTCELFALIRLQICFQERKGPSVPSKYPLEVYTLWKDLE